MSWCIVTGHLCAMDSNKRYAKQTVLETPKPSFTDEDEPHPQSPHNRASYTVYWLTEISLYICL